MKTIRIPFWIVLLLSFGVSSCQSPPFSPDSPLSPVPVQSRLILHETLTIPTDQLSLWFQDGKQMLKNDLNFYHPHCKFETLNKQDSPKQVRPDTFSIHKVVRWDNYVSNTVRLAQLRFGVGMGMVAKDSGGIGPLNAATEMFLKSEKQPDVYRMVCSQWEDANDLNHVTINQIQRTLGKIFTLELPAEYQADRK